MRIIPGDDLDKQKADTDHNAQTTLIDLADKYNAILSIYNNEGDFDGVPGTLTPFDVTIPAALKAEEARVKEADTRGDLFYTSLSGKRYFIVPIFADVVEGTGAAATNDVEKIIKDRLSGASSIIAMGEAVRQLGKMPEMYALQFDANFGRYAAEFRSKTTTTASGDILGWDDPELYAQEPWRIVDVLNFAWTKFGRPKGISKANFKIRFTVMGGRSTEFALIKALNSLKESTYPKLVLNLITAGTVAPGFKSVLNLPQHTLITGEANDVDFEMMLTRGGGPEARWNLVVGHLLSSTGAVSKMRDANKQMGDDKSIQNQSKRYDFDQTQQNLIRHFRGAQADSIINGTYVHTMEELGHGATVAAFASVTASGILRLHAANAHHATVITLSTNPDGTPVIRKEVKDDRLFEPDRAALANVDQTLSPRDGGINLDASLYNMEVKHDSRGMVLPTSEQPIGQFMKVIGFTPVFLNIQRNINLPARLGANLDKSKEQLALSSSVTG